MLGRLMMFRQKSNSILIKASAALFLFLVSGSAALADQITITYVDASFDQQTLTIGCDAPAQALALAASLLGEDGVRVDYEPGCNAATEDQPAGSIDLEDEAASNLTGSDCCSLADIAAAMATAAPLFAANVAQALSLLSPENTAAIVTAVNAVPGVNTEAVLAAVHFGPYDNSSGPLMTVFGSNPGNSIGISGVESVPSRN